MLAWRGSSLETRCDSSPKPTAQGVCCALAAVVFARQAMAGSYFSFYRSRPLAVREQRSEVSTKRSRLRPVAAGLWRGRQRTEDRDQRTEEKANAQRPTS